MPDLLIIGLKDDISQERASLMKKALAERGVDALIITGCAALTVLTVPEA